MQHVFPTEAVAGLEAVERGLTTPEVDERRRLYGANDILEDHRTGWLDVARNTAGDAMVWLLAGTALLFAWIGERIEAAVMALALVPIVGMDAFLHRRTLASTEGLAGQLAARTRVLRDGESIEVPAIDLVPGDLAIVAAGASFPADGIILAGANLQVDESALTGEAMPVRKRAAAGIRRGKENSSVDDDFWAAAGTRLLTGEARLRVVFTGGRTLYGEIVRSASLEAQRQTPLQRAVGRLVAVLTAIAVAICLALALTRYMQGHGPLDALVSAVTLAVAAIPEEFPVAFTFFLGVGVYRLARRRALVRRSVAVENIGRVTCICSDKTGTLTEGRLRAAHLIPAQGFDGDGLHRIAAAASREESGDPMDVALLNGAPKSEDEPVAMFPFTEDRRREVAVLSGRGGGLTAVVKGAPETVLAMCGLTRSAKERWLAEVSQLAANGRKVIACARKPLRRKPFREPESGYVFAGLVAFEDPVRDGVKEAVRQALGAGIRVVMITGDHAATAAAIARATGIGDAEPRVIEGPELEDRLRSPALQSFDVVARATPVQKLDLVRAFKSAGEIVAVTGDGVNDVPALQGADIGIAMGERGTRPAREAAMIVLLDDSFRTIIRAIGEGRRLFWNLRLSFAYLLMIHIPLVIAAALIPFAGYPLLFLPVHVVWLELIIHPTAILVFQQSHRAATLGPVARSAKARFFTLREWLSIAAVGALISAGVAGGYVFGLGPDGNSAHGRTVGLITLILASAAVTLGLSRLQTRAAIFAALLSALSALLLVQYPPTALLLHLSPLHSNDWAMAAMSAAAAGLMASSLPARTGRNA